MPVEVLEVYAKRVKHEQHERRHWVRQGAASCAFVQPEQRLDGAVLHEGGADRVGRHVDDVVEADQTGLSEREVSEWGFEAAHQGRGIISHPCAYMCIDSGFLATVLYIRFTLSTYAHSTADLCVH